MASVVRNSRTSTPSASTTTAIVVSGLGLVEHVGEHDAEVGGAGISHHGSEVVGDRLGTELGRRGPHGPGVWSGDDGHVNLAGVQLAPT